MNPFLKKVGRGLLAGLYVAVPIVGWVALARSFKRVSAGEISIVSSLNGGYELLEEGFYFRPLPGERFGNNFNKSADFIHMGPVKRVRIKEGEQGVVNDNGVYKPLNVGIHIIDSTVNQTFNEKTDIQKINQLDYVLGQTRYITILNGELGESYREGQFVLLEPGKHALPANHNFVKKVSVANDIVDLGALKIVTVKQGQVAIINGPEGNIYKGPGKHYIQQTEGQNFDQVLVVSSQVLNLDPLVVMCSDKIDMKAQAVLVYEIKEPLKTVGLGVVRVLNDLKEYAEGTLRSILRRFSSSDIAQTLHEDENHSSHEREKKLKEIHDVFVKDLDTKAHDWGIKISDLQFTHILPANEKYHATIRDLGVKQSTAEANKTLAESEAVVANIRALAEKSKVTAAEIEQSEAKVRAETDSLTKNIQSQAEYNQTVARARAQADSIKMIADAECERLTKLGRVADGFQTETAKSLAIIDKQTDLYKKIENPIFIQPELGQSNVWGEGKKHSFFFTTRKDANGSSANSVVDYLALETAKRTNELSHRK